MLDSYAPGQQAALKVNEDYWGKAPKNDGLIIRYYSKSSTMKLALQKGDIDMAFRDFTPTELKSLSTQKGIVVHTGNGSAIRYLVLNVTRTPTNNPAVRRAIAYLMPRNAIASRVYNGLVQPLYSMVPKGLPGPRRRVQGRLRRARRASRRRRRRWPASAKPVNLESGTRRPTTATPRPTSSPRSSARSRSSGLFKVTLKSAEWAQYSDALGKQYGVFQLGWFPDYVDAENYLLPFYQSSSNFTENKYNSPRMNGILKRSRRGDDAAAPRGRRAGAGARREGRRRSSRTGRAR